MGSKIVYTDVSLKSFTLEAATQLKNDALTTITELLKHFTLTDRSQRSVSVSVALDELAYNKAIFKQASAKRLDGAKYRIEIGVGLLAQLSLIARAIAADKQLLRGRTKSTLLDVSTRKDGREKALGNFIFHFMLAFVLWHEVAHIALGHLDWLDQKAQLNAIDEFGQAPSASESIHYQTLEGDADRQAAIWTTSVIDYALTSNNFLRYQATADAFYDIGYIYGALFAFLDSVDGDVPWHLRRHPKADVRLGIALSFVEEYLVNYRKDSRTLLMQQIYAGGIKAISTILHSEKKPFDLLGVAEFMTKNGDRIDAMQLRSFQHTVTNSPIGSFSVT